MPRNDDERKIVIARIYLFLSFSLSLRDTAKQWRGNPFIVLLLILFGYIMSFFAGLYGLLRHSADAAFLAMTREKVGYASQ